VTNTDRTRMPDSILYEHSGPVTVSYSGAVYRTPGQKPVGHKAHTHIANYAGSVELEYSAACGDKGANMLLDPQDAAYIAEACVNCF